jgi:hypothetical protein
MVGRIDVERHQAVLAAERDADSGIWPLVPSVDLKLRRKPVAEALPF